MIPRLYLLASWALLLVACIDGGADSAPTSPASAPDADADVPTDLLTDAAPTVAPQLAQLALNESRCRGGDWIELINLGDEEAEVADWQLRRQAKERSVV